MEPSDKEQGKRKVTEVKTFSVPLPLGENKESITINTNTPSKPSKEQIINHAIKFHLQGNISEASKYYQYYINQGFKDHRVFSNYGTILKDLGKLKEAELSYRKAIELNPDFADGYSNLGIILKDLGKLKEAEVSTRKAIDLNPDFAEAYLNLGTILSNLGKLEESISSFKNAIKIKPNFLRAHTNISYVLRDYIWFTNTSSYLKSKNIEKLIELEKKKLKHKLIQYPIWFVDIPRSSSTTTQLLMWNTFGWPFGKRTRILKDKIVHERSLFMPNHTPAIITKYLLGEKDWDALKSFSIVRNPYTWCVSFWQYNLRDIAEFKYQCLSFLKFLNLLEENLKVEPKERKINHMNLKQTDYLLDQDGKILVKKILKFEEKEKIKSFFLDNNINFQPSVHKNKNKNNNYQITNTEKKIIERLFARDFEILGYS